MFLDREALLKRDELKIEKVDLGSDNFVYVRQMTGQERDLFEQSLRREVRNGKEVTYEPDLNNFRAKLAVNTICDENGDNVLKPNDYTVLSSNISAAKLEKIVEAAQELNKISDDDKEQLVKNSEAVQSGGDISE